MPIVSDKVKQDNKLFVSFLKCQFCTYFRVDLINVPATAFSDICSRKLKMQKVWYGFFHSKIRTSNFLFSSNVGTASRNFTWKFPTNFYSAIFVVIKSTGHRKNTFGTAF